MSAAVDLDRVAGAPVLARDEAALPATLTRGADIPDDLDPFAEGILMDHQKAWLEDQSDLKLAEKGRRTGITFAEALDDTLIAAAKRSAGGSNVFYIGDTKDKGREFIGYVAHFAKVIAGELHPIEEFLFKDEREDGTSKDISAFRITFASGYRVEALSSNPANIRGLQGVVVIDEAAFHKDVREVIDAVNALLIWGGNMNAFTIDAKALCVQSLSFSDGRTPRRNKFMNCPGTDVTERNLTGRMVVKTPAANQFDIIGLARSTEKVPLLWEIAHGGSTLRIAAPAVQLKYGGETSIDGELGVNIDLVFTFDQGDDEIAITFS